MSNQESCRAAREAQRETARDGRKTLHEDAIARYLAAFAYAEGREAEAERREEEAERREEERAEQTRGGEATR